MHPGGQFRREFMVFYIYPCSTVTGRNVPGGELLSEKKIFEEIKVACKGFVCCQRSGKGKSAST